MIVTPGIFTNRTTLDKKNPHFNPSFSGGLKKNLRIGEAVLREFNSEFPKINSPFRIGLSIELKKDVPKYQQLIPRLLNLETEKWRNIDTMRLQVNRFYLTLDSYIKNLSSEIIKNNYSANCDECGDILQYKVLKKGIPTHNISFRIMEKNTGKKKEYGSHVFTVFGLKKNGVATNPKTWGPEAVVVDAWDKTMPAFDAISTFKQRFGFNPDRHTMIYEEVPLDKALVSNVKNKFNAFISDVICY